MDLLIMPGSCQHRLGWAQGLLRAGAIRTAKGVNFHWCQSALATWDQAVTSPYVAFCSIVGKVTRRAGLGRTSWTASRDHLDPYWRTTPDNHGMT